MTSTPSTPLSPLPPPPPSPTTSSRAGQRQQQQQQPLPPSPQRSTVPRPPALNANLAAVQQQYGQHLSPHTPSASSLHGPLPLSASIVGGSAPLVSSPLASSGLMNSYNPQDWGRGGPVGGAYLPHAGTPQARSRSSREATGMEQGNLPSPPPPYSAAASPNVNANATPSSSTPYHSSPQQPNIFAASLTNSPLAERSTPSSAVSPFTTQSAFQPAFPIAQQPAGTATFPPPPGDQRDRSTSRTRGMFSNLTALASRHRGSDTSPLSQAEQFQHQRSGSQPRNTPTSALRTEASASDGYNVLPPNARRSASAGIISPSTEHSRSTSAERDGAAPGASWEQGMPLPGPPPGPPPSSSRSQSMNRTLDPGFAASVDSTQVVAPMPTRLARGSNLGPIPPTPADWVEENEGRSTPAQPSSARTGLRIDTNTQEQRATPKNDVSISNPPQIIDADALQADHAASTVDRLPRMQPRKDGGSSIRERRSESRARSKDPQPAAEPEFDGQAATEEAKPPNLVLQSSNNSSLGRRRHVAKAQSSPRSGGLYSSPSSGGVNELQDSTSPRNASISSVSQQGRPPRSGGITTPPASGGPEKADGRPGSSGQAVLANARALPTPPEQETNSATVSKPNSANRIVSPLHKVVENGASTVPPVSPARPTTSSSSQDQPLASNVLSNQFSQDSLERFRVFLEREATASDDQEKLELFADFVVNESRLRRDKYSDAFEAMGSDVLDLTRDLWRSFGSTKRPKKNSVGSVDEERPNTSSGASQVPPRTDTNTPQDPSSASSQGSAMHTPLSEIQSPTAPVNPARFRSPELQRQNSYQPVLSPIPSMAVSTVPDEIDSRGRPASRWWEDGESGSHGTGGRKLERSKRESKYMGLPREARENLQWEAAEPSPSFLPGPSNSYANLGPDEYPQEKVGWHEEQTGSQPPTTLQTPRTPQRPGLDVSRLITLPPPYPRHHPAVNNNHPDLAPLRANLRALNETPELTTLRETYKNSQPEPSPLLSPQSLADRRHELRLDIQEQITSGTISFADAAAAESAFDDAEGRRHREHAQQSFDIFQSSVLNPLSAILREKISEAGRCLETLRADLLDSAHSNNPNQPQEEGDEQPETLEKVTLMKWFFEAREQLHRDVYDLQGESDEMYKLVILAPYKVSSNAAKIAEVDAFFGKDTRDRRAAFNKVASRRFEAFLATVDAIVSRGVEAQLSAFWDIAPGLLAVVQKVPADDPPRLHAFEVQIPPQEVTENPQYAEHPLQYLFTLLQHAGKSTYQFIESQTNLLCLLHEVKTGAMAASCRLLESQRAAAATDPEALADDGQGYTAAPGPTEERLRSLRAEMEGVRADEDARLTAELKDRVHVVEEQWRSALGGALTHCKDKVQVFLEDVGGWDDALLE